jgi:hypothetical protein
MIKRPIDYIFLEGPDLSGKTTLYESIHKLSNYRWNIQDRSALSMLVHARYYKRDTFRHVEQLRSELFNLNNLTILLLPKWDVIIRRFSDRGDEIQNLSSLKKIYDLFSEAAEELKHYPNFIIMRETVDDQSAKYLLNQISYYEDSDTRSIANNCVSACLARESKECLGLNFTLFDNGDFEDVDAGDLLYEKEVDYYQEILESVKDKIVKELSGENEYNRNETKASRRFIYTSNSCISLAHFLLRENGLDCKYFLRSSNVKDTLYYDLNFLKFLSSEIYKILNAQGTFCRMSFIINSGHILDIINEE